MLTIFILKVRYFLGRFMSFMKRYGYIIAIILALIIAYIIFRKSTKTSVISSMWKIVERERDLHMTYVQKTKEIHEKQVENVTTAGQRALDAVRQAEIEYDKRHEVLDENKKKLIQTIVNKHAIDPNAAAKELADKLGFVYVP